MSHYAEEHILIHEHEKGNINCKTCKKGLPKYCKNCSGKGLLHGMTDFIYCCDDEGYDIQSWFVKCDNCGYTDEGYFYDYYNSPDGTPMFDGLDDIIILSPKI